MLHHIRMVTIYSADILQFNSSNSQKENLLDRMLIANCLHDLFTNRYFDSEKVTRGRTL